MEVENEKEDLGLELSIVKEEYSIQDLFIRQEQTSSSPVPSDPARTAEFNEKPFECPICLARFSSQHARSGHFRVHRNIKRRLKCRVCEKTFNKTASYMRHMEKHANEDSADNSVEVIVIPEEDTSTSKQLKLLSCEICRETFSDIDRLMNHLNSHFKHKHRTFSCRLCKKSFQYRSEVSKHINEMHKDLTETLQEELLERQIKVSSYQFMSKYIKEEPGTRCLYCSNTFTDDYHLGVHTRVFHRGLPENIADGPVSPKICSVVIRQALPMQLWKKPAMTPKQTSTALDMIRNTIRTGSMDTFCIDFIDPVTDCFTCPLCTETFGNQKQVVDHVMLVHTSKTSDTNATPYSGEYQPIDEDSPVIIVEDSIADSYPMQASTWQEVVSVQDDSLMINYEITIKDDGEDVPMEEEHLAANDDVIEIKDEEITIEDEQVTVEGQPLQSSIGSSVVLVQGNETRAQKKDIWKTCVNCNETFESTFQLKLHWSTAHGAIQFFMCPKCKKSFMTFEEVMQHYMTHSEESSEESSPEESLPEEPQEPPEFQAITCNNCGISLFNKSYLQEHLLKFCRKPSTSSEQQVEHKCVRCGFVYTEHHHLRKHMLSMHYTPVLSSKPYECRVCNMRFGRKAEAIDHISTCDHILNVLYLAPTEEEFIDRWFIELPVDLRENSIHLCKYPGCEYEKKTLESLRRETQMEIFKRGLTVGTMSSMLRYCPLQITNDDNLKSAQEAFKSAVFFKNMENVLTKL